jgi:formamidopyrimidine-DNA glycosylase
MPELPEVETIVRGLQGPLLGRTFEAVEVTWRNSVRPSPTIVCQRLPGKRIEHLSRRGKYLRFDLSDGYVMFIHLKMSGDLLVEPLSTPRHPHVRTIFRLDNGHELRFKDPRKFGRVFLTTDPAEVVGHLGPEPLATEFSLPAFETRLKGRRGCLKALLLKQDFVAGIGNIYADESCFHARINPLRRAENLSADERRRLFKAVRKVLRRGIMLKGSSFDAVYRGGEFQDHFAVYGRTGEPCRVCRTPVRRTLVGQRSTHYCPTCQRRS